MKRLIFYVDVISPYAYLAFERLPQVLEGISHEVEYRPLLFAGLLQHWGNVGPAEIEPKRAWTFRHVHWLAATHGIRLETPAVHPFNPLPLLRLALASAPDLRPNRRIVEELLRHVWHGGGDPGDARALAALKSRLAPVHDVDAASVKQALRDNTEAALAAGVFGVPTIAFEGRHFWGLDSLPMLRDALAGGAWFQGPEWDAQGLPRAGVVRKR